MRFPELLYVPTDRDVTVGLAPLRRALRATNQANLTVVSAFLENDRPDRAWVITNLDAIANSGGGQTCDQLNILVTDNVTAAVLWRVQTRYLPAALNQAHNWTGEIVLLPGERIALTGFFDAAVNVNTVELGVHGWFVQRGNIQFG